MAEFDEVAYEAASNLFHEAKRIRHSLPSLIAQVNDTADMLGAQRYDQPNVKDGGNHVEQAMVDGIGAREGLEAKLEESRGHYREVAANCEAAILDMEKALEGDWLDSAVLRYFYMQDMDVPNVVKKLKKDDEAYYTESWIYQKKEIALVRVSAAVRRLHLF